MGPPVGAPADYAMGPPMGAMTPPVGPPMGAPVDYAMGPPIGAMTPAVGPPMGGPAESGMSPPLGAPIDPAHAMAMGYPMGVDHGEAGPLGAAYPPVDSEQYPRYGAADVVMLPARRTARIAAAAWQPRALIGATVVVAILLAFGLARLIRGRDRGS